MTAVPVWNWVSGTRLRSVVDSAHPVGSCHHQKIVVIDEALAFCGGIDMTIDRWDTSEHADENRFRQTPGGQRYDPRHDVAVAVDGAAAGALAETARSRWRAATGEVLASVERVNQVWPGGLEPMLRDVEVATARTLPAQDDNCEVREVEALYLAAIAAARHTLYVESQYLASRTLAEALAARLREADGPEIVVVLPRNAQARIEQHTMDGARHEMLQLLWAADHHGHLGVYWPVAAGGTPILVHAKVLVLDDRLLRIGSSNLNNRSMGFDTECDVAVEADPCRPDHDTIREAIVGVRQRLVCEHLGVSAAEFDREMNRCGSFLGAVESLRTRRRTLRRFDLATIANEASPLAENDLLDPAHANDSLIRRVTRFISAKRKLAVGWGSGRGR